MTLVETPWFLRDAESRMTDSERVELISFLAGNPEAGDVMPGTGGVRKLRWGTKGRGKRGGVRVIYYMHSSSFPLFLLSVSAKNEKSNLSQSQKNELRALVPKLLAGYQKRRSR